MNSTVVVYSLFGFFYFSESPYSLIMMTFIPIEDILPGIAINLRVLSRGTERYKMALYQHEGVLNLTQNQTKLGNNANPSVRFKTFFDLAKEQNVDLAMTPEYSCPWQVISEILDNPESWPNTDKLWAIGAESITPQELTEFYDRYNQNSTTVYFDQNRLNDNGVFFDPLVYIFQANIHDSPQLIVLIQFKTHHMGVWAGGDLERDRIIEGQEIYVIRNSTESVQLLTLICSEAMNFHQELDAQKRAQLSWNDRPFLILNPQVNPDPTHERFLAFRAFALEQERKEVIGLNWNFNSKIAHNSLLREGTSRSGIYMLSNDINFNDKSRLVKNHKLGLYYFYSGNAKHAFILNSKPHVFILDQLSVSITQGVAQQRMRNGPELMATYEFHQDETLQNVADITDNHLESLQSLGCKNTFLIDAENCVLEKERLVCLSSGEFLPKSFEGWSSTEKLFSFRLNTTEVNLRITYTEDNSAISEGQRRKYITSINEIDYDILPDKALYPKSLADLVDQEVFLGYSQKVDGQHRKHIDSEKYRYNLVNAQGEMIKASICCLGLANLKTATETFEFIQSMFDTDSMNRRRVVVFYKVGNEYQVKSDDNAGSIVIAEDKPPTSFLK